MINDHFSIGCHVKVIMAGGVMCVRNMKEADVIRHPKWRNSELANKGQMSFFFLKRLMVTSVLTITRQNNTEKAAKSAVDSHMFLNLYMHAQTQPHSRIGN